MPLNKKKPRMNLVQVLPLKYIRFTEENGYEASVHIYNQSSKGVAYNIQSKGCNLKLADKRKGFIQPYCKKFSKLLFVPITRGTEDEIVILATPLKYKFTKNNLPSSIWKSPKTERHYRKVVWE